MKRGWVKVYRRLFDNPYWQEKPFTRGQAWVDMIMLANHKDGHIRKRGIRVLVKRGQFGHSQGTLCDRWGWSRGKVRRFFTELQTDKQIEQQKNNVTTLISIVNYNDYQENDTPNSTAKVTASDTPDGPQTVQEQECKELLRKQLAQNARYKDLKKLAAGSRNHTLCDKYGQECGIVGASYDELKSWASSQVRKMEREIEN